MGFPKPVSVLGATYSKIGMKKPALGSSWMWDPKKFEVEDLGVGLIKFEGGATLFLEASFATNIEREEFNSHLYGDKGGASLEPFRVYTEFGGILADVVPVGIEEPRHRRSVVTGFIEAIQKGKPVPIPGEEALITTRVLDAIYESAEKGKEVRIAG
jgi:predicted dehydrogenase